jgi:hypothetical protein
VAWRHHHAQASTQTPPWCLPAAKGRTRQAHENGGSSSRDHAHWPRPPDPMEGVPQLSTSSALTQECKRYEKQCFSENCHMGKGSHKQNACSFIKGKSLQFHKPSTWKKQCK